MKRYSIILLYFLAAFCFVTLFCYTTSFLYSEYADTQDSYIFQVIGKYWAEGHIPYLDLWDMKGPFIFWINALGYLITGSKIGVFFIQVISLFISLVFIHQIFREYFSIKYALLFTLCSLAHLSYIYESGNLTEEYLLPFLSAAFYCIIKWVKNIEDTKTVKHHPYGSILYGAVLGISLLSRLTNALSVSAAFLVILCVLLVKKEYRNFHVNILSFLLGFLLVVIPFLIYFYDHDALLEMLNATLIYHAEYASNPSKDILQTGIHYFILSYINCIFLLIIVLCKYKYCNVSIRWLWTFTAFFPFIWFCQGNGFGHYGMIVFPLFAIIITYIRKYEMRKTFIIFMLLILIGFASKIRNVFVMYHWQNETIKNYKCMLQQVPTVDYTSFVAYNCHPAIYLEKNILPANRFFAMQDFGNGRLDVQKQLILESFDRSSIKWILMNDEDESEVNIKNILSDRYHIVCSDDKHHLKLYKLNED